MSLSIIKSKGTLASFSLNTTFQLAKYDSPISVAAWRKNAQSIRRRFEDVKVSREATAGMIGILISRNRGAFYHNGVVVEFGTTHSTRKYVETYSLQEKSTAMPV